MNCRRCRTPNPEGAVFCSGCGRPLLRRPSFWRTSARPLLLAGGGAAILILSFFLYRHFAPVPQARPARAAESAGAAVRRTAPPADGSITPTFGEVIVRSAAGREGYRITTPIFGGAWAAVPVSAMFGGAELAFQPDGSVAVGIADGTWAPEDPVGFWKVESGYPPASVDLAAWRPSLPLDWRPSRSTGPALRIEVGASRRAGSFTGFPGPPELRSPGFFLQEGAIVGWTFGEPFDQAYLWTGAPAAGPTPAIKAAQFFSAVSSDCREGYFRRLLDVGPGASPAAELEALARGFRRAPLLAAEDLPPDLRPAAIVGRMNTLAGELIESGLAGEVIRILDDQIIRESADPLLARDAVLALAGQQEYNRTIRRLEAIERDVFAVRGPVPAEFSEIKSRLYKDWLRKIIEKGDYYSGAVAFEEARRAFPDDPEIRLLGAEIAVADNNPDLARELLEEGGFPGEMQERADQLGAQLEDKPDESEDVIIRFDPAQSSIYVDAVINGSFTQKFIVDTGASIVSIPSATAAALKIKYDDALPTRAMATASGVVVAYEVTLDSIELDRCRVNNVTALVMDMPLEPESGLLGLNFLEAFNAEIDRPNGILRLKKRPS